MLRMYKVTITDGERSTCSYLLAENLTEIMKCFKGTKATSISVEDVTDVHIFTDDQMIGVVNHRDDLSPPEII